MSDSIAPLLIAETRRRLFEESIPRLKKCLAQLEESEIWQHPNAHLVSVGNLTLHLCGNVRQWVVSGLGKAPDQRDRDSEFEEKGPIPVEILTKKLDLLQADTEAVLDRLSADALTARYRVQGFEESGVSILVHVVEHFSYHVGQITWYTKLLRDRDMGYYADLDLNEK